MREQDPTLRSYNLAGFTKLVFDNCPELKHYVVRGPGGSTWHTHPWCHMAFQMAIHHQAVCSLQVH